MFWNRIFLIHDQFLIILITNKMKITTQLSLINRLITNNTCFFSNLIKDRALSLDDLVINHSKNTNNITPSTTPNKSKLKKISTEIINADSNKVKVAQMINLLDKTFSNSALHTHTTSLTFKKDIPSETQIDNAVEFMKYLDHTLQKTVALEIIKMIEKYCSRKNYLDKENSTLLNVFGKQNKNQAIQKHNQETLFENIKKHLIHNFNFYSEDIEVNNQLIQSLLQMLAKSDPTHINSQFFQRESFCLDEEERTQKSTGKQYFLENSIKYSQNQQIQSMPYQKTEESKYKLALQQAFQLKDRTKFSKLRLKKNHTQQSNKSKSDRPKMATEKIIFRKKNTESIIQKQAKEDDLKSAYIYELPYNITEDEAQKFIKYLQQSKSIKVQSYVLFPYKQFLQKNHYDVIFRIPEKYQDHNVHIQKTLKNISIDEFTKVGNKKTPKRGQKKTKKEQYNNFPLDNEPNGKKVVTDALLLKIKKQNYSKFNKSSMIIKFATKEDKQAILTKESRLYGLCYQHLRNIKFEQGYSKTTISLSGVAWGCSSKDFEAFLNKILEPEKIPITVQQDCILTKSMISIQFDHLSEALTAIKKLNNITFQNKTIRAHLKYGSCKLYNSKYNLKLEDQYDKLKKKIDLLGTYFQKKYDQESQCPQQ